MDITIETATIKLLNKLYEIEKLSFKKEAFSKQQISYLLTDYNSISLVAKVNDEIVGFVIGQLGFAQGIFCGHIFTLETLPTYRRKGVAEKLLRQLETLFLEKGATESRLEVREGNTAALGLYGKLDYEQTEKLNGYYGDAHGLYLRKNLIHQRA